MTSSYSTVSTQAGGPSTSSIGSGGNVIVFLAAPMVIVILALVGVIVVMAICK